VQFQDGILRWVRIDEIEQIPKHPSKTVSVPKLPTDENFISRRMIEAFRMGIVPYNCIKDFTFGRDKEIQELRHWLHTQNNNILFLIGGYGTGKTHLLHYLYGHALQEGFAVAFAEIDPNETPFNKPKRIYGHLAENFRYRSLEDGQVKRFIDFLKEVVAKGAFKDHIYFRHIIGKFSDELLCNWIEARETIDRLPFYSSLPKLYDFATAANIYTYLLSALGWAAKEVLGLKGLVLIFDEAENISTYVYRYEYQKSFNFLRALIKTANNDKSLLKRPIESGLIYCRRSSSLQFLYRVPSGLKLIFAHTEHEDLTILMLKVLFPSFPIDSLDLIHLPDVALKEVFEHICLLYDSAYNFLEEDLTINAIYRKLADDAGRTRLFVKASVEALDLARAHPKKKIDDLL